MSYKPVYICSRRKTVDEFNQSAIEEYSKGNPTTTYQAKYDGPLTTELPCSKTLTFGVGVRVMTICNEKNYKNGMLGTVKSLSDDKVVVKFDNGKTVTIKRKTFELEKVLALFHDLCKHGKWHKIQNGNRAGKSQDGLPPIIAY